MLAINTQLSGLIMWNCGKFTWGSGTNDIRVWPCVSEMAPAPAAGTLRLPRKIWSHFVVLDASPHPPLPLRLSFLTALPLPPPISPFFSFPSHFTLKFVNLSGFLLCPLFFLHLLLLALFRAWSRALGFTPLEYSAASSSTTCVSPEQCGGDAEAEDELVTPVPDRQRLAFTLYK